MSQKNMRVAALRRFATAITVLTVIGHGLLGFEQSLAYIPAALVTAYVLELLLETLDAKVHMRVPQYSGGWVRLMDFLLPAHITGLACAMLLYSNERLWPIAFAVSVAVGSKYIFRIRVGGRRRHFLNPSNIGIVATLLLFPWVGIAPPYQFTENLVGAQDWMLVALFVSIGTFLNIRFTGRIALIMAWLAGFFIQAVARSWIYGTPLVAALHPMTGVSFLLFTYYMISDPGTTPSNRFAQMAFGFSVAILYGVITASHIVFGLFFSLVPVCAARGAYLYATSLRGSQRLPREMAPEVRAG